MDCETMSRGVLHRFLRPGSIALLVAALLGLAGCAAGAVPASPPTIEHVGIATGVAKGQGFVRYTFRDGSTREINPQWYRQLTRNGWGGSGLVVVGDDRDGPFVASLLPQDGLPPDCYVGNVSGIERGNYVEMWGVLWEKASNIVSSADPGVGFAYPSGTRFCFNEAAEVTEVVGPQAETDPHDRRQP